MYQIELSDRASNKIRKLSESKTETEIAAVISGKLNLLEEGNFDLLEISTIKRKKKEKILEVKIRNPKSYRIFFIKYEHITAPKIRVLDIKEKKVQALNSKYFKGLDRLIKLILN